MEIPSPYVLGQLLGLSEDGTAADLSEMSEEEKTKLEPAVTQHLDFYKTISAQQADSYIEEFSSVFLPSLIRTLVAVEDITDRSFYANVVCLPLCRQTAASFPRFIRHFPDEACALYLKVWDPLEYICANLDRAMEADNGPGQIAKLFDVTFYTLVGLSKNLPASTTFPSLPLTTKIIFRAVANRFDNEPRLRAPLEARGLWKTFALKAVLHLVNVEEPRRHVASSGLDKIGHVWWSCEANRVVWTTGSDCSPCAKLGDGEEMMACSRCLGVRYCSK
ncbi:hypothetical protein BDY24DRAFT_374747, partial [Mrakia frigida]|uniref:uncharacterized protein n=1 Tax=Mrakia frigida TaxID=29902 RepID=UPI003FCC2611